MSLTMPEEFYQEPAGTVGYQAARVLRALLYLTLVASPLLIVSSATAEDRPNIVLIMADDLGYGDLSCDGATRLKTPRIDRLAKEGLKFPDFHSNAASRSPTRAALLTGQYQQRAGVETALSEKSPGLPDQAVTIAEYLKTAGYSTGLFGKWHLGSRPDSAALPNRQGFDEFRGSRHGAVDYASHVDRYGRLDAGVGRVMNAIQSLPSNRETLVIFNSHNGGYLRYSGGMNNISSNGPLRGQKISMYEGGHRVPCLAWWPGRIPAGSETDATTMTMDLLPTFLELAGVDLPADHTPQAIDGVSLTPLLFRNRPPESRTLFWRTGNFKAVRHGEWKLVIHHGGLTELYNLKNDLSERNDLAATNGERLRDLLNRLAAWEHQLSRSS